MRSRAETQVPRDTPMSPVTVSWSNGTAIAVAEVEVMHEAIVAMADFTVGARRLVS